ncbi:MAG: PDZ domain-containing protein [Pirellulales bacterium]
MRISTDNLLCRAGWLGVAAGALLLGSSALAQEIREEVSDVLKSDDDAAPGDVLGEHWIGVMCTDVPDVLRAHLDLPKEQGILIVEVPADSPASKAGLEKNDVIVAVEDKPISSPRELLEAVRSAGERELTVRYLRGGKEHAAMIKPAKRPDEYRPGQPSQPGEDQRAIEKWFKLPLAPFRMRTFQPGMVLPPGAKVDNSLPDDMSVNVFKKGDEPAKITVKQADETWEVTEDSLDKLPAEIRGHVERMLGRMPLAMGPWKDMIDRWSPPGRLDPWNDFNIEVVPPDVAPDRFPGQFPGRRPFTGEAPEGLEQTLERLNRELEQLRKAVEKLEDKAGT